MKNLEERQRKMRERIQEQKAAKGVRAEPSQPPCKPPSEQAEPAQPVVPPKRVQVWVHKQIVFSVSTYGGRNFEPNDSAGAFLDHLMELCGVRPEYLRPADAVRLLTMLPQVRDFVFKYYDCGQELERRVADSTIDMLHRRALESWVFSFIRQEPEQPLMPFYALDAAEFIRKHIQGTYEHTFRLEPMVKGVDKRGELFDASFKREFTRRVGRVLAEGQVPDGANLKAEVSPWQNPKIDPTWATRDGRFWFMVERCQLSSSFHDQMLADLQEEPQEHDICSDFRLYGDLLLRRDSSATFGLNEWRESLHGKAFIPGRWLTHGYREQTAGHGDMTRVPVSWVNVPTDSAGQVM